MPNPLPFDFVTHKGMTLSFPGDRAVELKLSDPIGEGTMTGYLLSPHVAVCLVDFACEECPSMMPASRFFGGGTARRAGNAVQAGSASESLGGSDAGEWFSINYCIEGRCETDIPHVGVAVVGLSLIHISEPTRP